MKPRQILLAAACCVLSAASGQTLITGRVVEQSSSEDVTGAVVTLIENDSVRTGQTQTDAGGRFAVSATQAGTRTLRVTMLGYEPAVVAVIGDDERIDVGYVFLTESSVQLDEVTVYGSGIIEKVDKYIVLPSTGQLDRSAQSIDLFAQLDLPGLRTDPILRSIKVEDRTPVYLVNGREQPLYRILNLNPKDILRIEYSNNPGIRYLDKGYSGVINVVLRERQQGGSLFVQGSGALNAKQVNGGVQGSYNYKKSEFVVSYNTYWSDYDHRTNDQTESYVAPDASVDRGQTGYDSGLSRKNHSVALEYNFVPELNTMLSARVQGVFSDFENEDNGKMAERPWKGTPFDFEKTSFSAGRSAMPSLDLFFSKKFKRQQSLELNMAGSYADKNHSSELLYAYTDGKTDRIANGADGHGYAFSGEAVYNKGFKNVVTRFGLQYTYNYDTNGYIDGQQSLQKKHNTYVYGELRGRLNKASYSIGTGMKTFTAENNAAKKTHYVNNSVATLLYPISKQWSLNYTLMYQPNIPSLSSLSPVVLQSDDRVYYTGNPNLKPSNWFYNRALVRFNNNKGMTWAFWLSYGRVFNPIVPTFTYNAAGEYFLSKPGNERYDDDMGVQVNFGYQNLWKHVNVFAECGYHHYETAGRNYRHSHDNFYSSLQLHVYFGKWTVSGSVTITPKSSLAGEVITENGRNSRLSLQYKIRNNLYVYGSVNYLFQKSGRKYQSENLSSLHPSSGKIHIRDYANMVSIGLSYNINFGKQMKKSRRTWKESNYESGATQF